MGDVRGCTKDPDRYGGFPQPKEPLYPLLILRHTENQNDIFANKKIIQGTAYILPPSQTPYPLQPKPDRPADIVYGNILSFPYLNLNIKKI